MFKNKKKEREVVVTTKEELKAAIKRKDPCIKVKGDLAKKLRWKKKLTPAMVALLIPLLATAAIPNPVAPISFAVSTAALTAITGEGVAAIIVASGLSVSLILAVIRGYDAEFKVGDNEVILP